jgi:metacaspase-1
MATALSLHIGLNEVNPDHYDGWDGKLVACEFDANDMEALAESQGYTTKKLLTKEATADSVSQAVADAGSELEDNGILFLTYSGHGGQVPDGNSEEEDRMDETWVLYDRQLVDDELYTLWSQFKPGTRIVVLSDSCHSGSVVRALPDIIQPQALARNGGGPPAMKAMPEELEKKVYERNRELYDTVQKSTTAYDQSEIGATVLLISGCQDNQTSADGERNGLFTQTLKSVWDEGQFKGNYRGFWKKIVKDMPLYQSPNFFTAGQPQPSFLRQRPFKV